MTPAYVSSKISSLRYAKLDCSPPNQLFVQLPSASNLDSDLKLSPMPTLVDLHSGGTPPQQLTPFCGLILVASPLRAVLQHTTQVETTPKNYGHHHSPGFWDSHYSVIKLLGSYEKMLDPIISSHALHSDSVVFNLFLVFHAVKLRLSEVALDESERQHLPASVTANSSNQLRINALKIASGVRSSWGRQRFAVS